MNIVRVALGGCDPQGVKWQFTAPNGARFTGNFGEVARMFFALSRRERSRIRFLSAECGAGHRHRIRLA